MQTLFAVTSVYIAFIAAFINPSGNVSEVQQVEKPSSVTAFLNQYLKNVSKLQKGEKPGSISPASAFKNPSGNVSKLLQGEKPVSIADFIKELQQGGGGSIAAFLNPSEYLSELQQSEKPGSIAAFLNSSEYVSELQRSEKPGSIEAFIYPSSNLSEFEQGWKDSFARFINELQLDGGSILDWSRWRTHAAKANKGLKQFDANARRFHIKNKQRASLIWRGIMRFRHVYWLGICPETFSTTSTSTMRPYNYTDFKNLRFVYGPPLWPRWSKPGGTNHWRKKTMEKYMYSLMLERENAMKARAKG